MCCAYWLLGYVWFTFVCAGYCVGVYCLFGFECWDVVDNSVAFIFLLFLDMIVCYFFVFFWCFSCLFCCCACWLFVFGLLVGWVLFSCCISVYCLFVHLIFVVLMIACFSGGVLWWLVFVECVFCCFLGGLVLFAWMFVFGLFDLNVWVVFGSWWFCCCCFDYCLFVDDIRLVNCSGCSVAEDGWFDYCLLFSWDVCLSCLVSMVWFVWFGWLVWLVTWCVWLVI